MWRCPWSRETRAFACMWLAPQHLSLHIVGAYLVRVCGMTDHRRSQGQRTKVKRARVLASSLLPNRPCHIASAETCPGSWLPSMVW